MNRIRKENISANQNLDENFFVVDEDRFNSTYVSSLFLIKKNSKVSKEAFGVLSLLLSMASLTNKNSKYTYSRDSKARENNVLFEFSEGYGQYFLSASISAPYKSRELFDTQGKLGKNLMRTIRSGWTKAPADLNRVIEDITYEYSLLDNDPIFQMDHLIYLNYLRELQLGRYPYGDLDKIKELKFLDLDSALKELIESPRMSAYVGDTNYRFVLSARKRLKPNSKIFPVTLKKEIVPRGTDLVVKNKKFKGEYVGFVFNLSKIHSEQTYVCNKILMELLFNKYYGLMLDVVSKERIEIVKTQLFPVGHCFIVYLHSDKKISEDFIVEFEKKITNFYSKDLQEYAYMMKRYLIEKIMFGFDNPRDLVESKYLGRLGGLNISSDVMITKLQNLNYKDFSSYLRKINFVGSMKIEGTSYEK